MTLCAGPECVEQIAGRRVDAIYCSRRCQSRMARALNPNVRARELALVGSPAKTAYLKQWREANPDANHTHRLARHYGLTSIQYDAMLTAQQGACAICLQPERGTRRLAVDHDHATGAVRGLLCASCNTAIGHMRDDPQRLRNAANYLLTHATQEA